jgi:hypothetical protein
LAVSGEGQAAYHTPLDVVIYYTTKKGKILRVKKEGVGGPPFIKFSTTLSTVQT